MQSIRQSEVQAARRTIRFLATNTSDDSAYTGVMTGADLMVAKANGNEVASTGVATHLGNGLYRYEFSVSEVDTYGIVSLRVNRAGLYGDVFTAQVVAFDPYNANSLGLTWLDAAISSRQASGVVDNGAAVWDIPNGVETGLTPRQAMRLLCAAILGETTGVGTAQEQFRAAVSDAKVRLTVDYSASNDRSNVVTDLN